MKVSIKTAKSGSRNLYFEEMKYHPVTGVATDVKRGIIPVDKAKADIALKHAQEHPEEFSWGEARGDDFYAVIYTPADAE